MEQRENPDYVSRLVGRCIRFNKRAGWGFIVLAKSAGEKADSEVFVHYKNLQAGDVKTRYLEEGEYVELEIVPAPQSDEGALRFTAVNVTGIEGGPLMCSTQQRKANKPKRATANREGTVKVYASRRDRSRCSDRMQRRQEQPWYVANI